MALRKHSGDHLVGKVPEITIWAVINSGHHYWARLGFLSAKYTAHHGNDATVGIGVTAKHNWKRSL